MFPCHSDSLANDRKCLDLHTWKHQHLLTVQQTHTSPAQTHTPTYSPSHTRLLSVLFASHTQSVYKTGRRHRESHGAHCVWIRYGGEGLSLLEWRTSDALCQTSGLLFYSPVKHTELLDSHRKENNKKFSIIAQLFLLNNNETKWTLFNLFATQIFLLKASEDISRFSNKKLDISVWTKTFFMNLLQDPVKKKCISAYF